MAKEVSIGGHKFSRNTLLVAGGGTGIGLFLWYRHKSAGASTAGTTAATGTGTGAYPSDGTTGNPSDPYSVDPATGMTYGDEQGGGFGIGGYGTSGFGGFPGYGGFPGGTGNPPPAPGPGSFTNNAQWAQYAETQLAFADPNAVSAALGKYLTGQPMTTDQEGLADQAIAIAGYPPVAGPGGFPPSMHQAGGNPGPGGGKVAVPNVVGGNWMGAIHALQAAGLKPSPSAKPSNAKDPITKQSPSAGTKVAKGSTVTLSSPHR